MCLPSYTATDWKNAVGTVSLHGCALHVLANVCLHNYVCVHSLVELNRNPSLHAFARLHLHLYLYSAVIQS
jgi:hypothetical protein